MQMVCSYCEKKLGIKEPKADSSTEYTMCVDCLEYFDKQWKGMSVADYLDSLAGPVVVLNEDSKMVSLNKTAEKMLGKSRNELTGLMAGEFLECEEAVASGGCGKSVRCASCVIRQTVKETMEQGVVHENVRAYFYSEEDSLPVLKRLLISTVKKDKQVYLSYKEA